MSITAPRHSAPLATLAAIGVLSALAWSAAPAQAQDLGVMLRFAQAQPGAALMLAQLRLRQGAVPVPSGPAPAAADERRGVPTTAAQPTLAVTAVAAGAAGAGRPAMLAAR